MAEAGKGKLHYRRPSCFLRVRDIDMFYDSDEGEYSCLRCCYHGDEANVLEKNRMARFRYRNLLTRFNFEEDE